MKTLAECMQAKYKVASHQREHGCTAYKAIQKRACRCVEDLRRPDQLRKKEKAKREEKTIKHEFTYKPGEAEPDIQEQIRKMMEQQKQDL